MPDAANEKPPGLKYANRKGVVMKFKTLLSMTVVVFVLGTLSLAYAETPVQNKAPKILFPESTHEFETVLDGAEVTHDFVVKNEGDAPLEIQKVRTG